MKENPLGAIMRVQTNPPSEGNEEQHGPKLTRTPLREAQFSHQLTAYILHLFSPIMGNAPFIGPRWPGVGRKIGKLNKKPKNALNNHFQLLVSLSGDS